MIGRDKVVDIDGTTGKPYDNIFEEITFSPDSKRYAYTAWIGNSVSMVVDGVEGKLYDFLVQYSFKFSSDSKSYSYEAFGSDGIVTVTDGVESTK